MRLVRPLISVWLFFAALTAAAPAAAPPAERATENVLLVTTDGLRWQELFAGADAALVNKEDGHVDNLDALKQSFWRDTPEARREALMPFFWRVVAKEGQVYGNVDGGSIGRVTNGKYFSYPGYNEMLTGAADERIDSNDKRPNPNVNVLEWLNTKPPYRGRVAAFCSWDVFPFIINTRRSGVPVNAGWQLIDDDPLTDAQAMLNRLSLTTPRQWEGSRYDAFTFYAALEHIKKHQPRVLYLSLDETDSWAHEGRYDRYLAAAHRVDGFLHELWQTLQSMPQYRGKTSLVITTDHGRGDPPNDWRSHGAKIKGAEYIWIAVLGPDTPALGVRANVPEVTQAQIAATLAHLLGEDYCTAVPGSAEPINDVVHP